MRKGRWVAVTVVCAAVCAVPAGALAGVPAWTTYHHDAGRSGIDPDSTSPVSPSQVWQTPPLDGEIWGQSLVYGSRVYVATENDTVYALDSATGDIVWQTHLATPVDASQLCNGDIEPTVGITSTPVIDPSTGRIYVVADTEESGDASTIAHELYALNLSDGSVAVGPVDVDPPNAPSGDTPANQLQRLSLALDHGEIVIGYGGNAGDCGNYHGWLVAAPESGSGPLRSFEVDGQPGDLQGAIWGSGNAPAIDSSGDIWVATGNGMSTTFDYSESVIKLDPNLNVLDWFAPSDWSSLDSADLDLGSTEPLLLPDGLVFEIGKQGIGYLLSAGDLGNPGNVGQTFDHWLYQAQVCSGSWGGGIYYSGVIYVACSDGMHALKLDTESQTFAPLSTWTVDSNAISPPIEAGGLILSADWHGRNLYGLDPSTGNETFVSDNLNAFEHFATPSAGGGLLFVVNRSPLVRIDQVTAFRVAETPPASPTSLSLSSSANPSAMGNPVTFTATVIPAPDAGSVAFTDGGAPIAGCGAVTPDIATGQAQCTATFANAGSYSIQAAYSGDKYYNSSSGSLSETVSALIGRPPPGSPPVISHMRLRLVHRKLRLTVTLSDPAWLTVVISRLVPGRISGHQCRATAKHGRRCWAAERRGKLRLSGKVGRHTYGPKMRELPPGSYAIWVTAVETNGLRSTPIKVVVIVRRT